MNILNALRDRTGIASLAVLAAAVVALHAQAPVVVENGAKIWIGRAPEMEAHLAKAEVARTEETKVGVTRPRHVFLKPGGPFGEMAFKPLPPGTYGGYRESYKSEIAAYELDKLLELNMVPPTIERTIDGKVGAAVMSISGTKSFKELGGAPKAAPRYLAKWNRELVLAKMFDDLIANEDPDLGNWLVDSEFNAILIDHSRSFGNGKRLTHELTRFHKGFWDRITALTEQQVASSTVGRWLDEGQIRAMFERRTEMQKVLDKLVKRNAAQAFVP